MKGAMDIRNHIKVNNPWHFDGTDGLQRHERRPANRTFDLGPDGNFYGTIWARTRPVILHVQSLTAVARGTWEARV
jgi:hypothetical protein